MRDLMAFGCIPLAYVFTGLALFGQPLGAAAYLAFLLVPLGAPLWPLAAVLGVALAWFLLRPFRGSDPTVPFRLAAFASLSQLLAVLFVAAYAQTWRSLAIAAFAADDVIAQSFFLSLHDRWREIRPVHAAVLKDCVPYAWSYREMAFYRLEPGTAVNVLPGEWLKRCSIKRPD